MSLVYARVVRGGLRGYKLLVSPVFGSACRFAPSCSEYTAQVLLEHGPWRGALLAMRRIVRCHPFGGSGYDPPPPRRHTGRRLEPDA